MKRYELRLAKKANGGEMRPARNGGWVAYAEAMCAIEAEREACAKEVPTTWLDPLLSGDKAALPLGQTTPRHIEALLRGIQDRIRAR